MVHHQGLLEHAQIEQAVRRHIESEAIVRFLTEDRLSYGEGLLKLTQTNQNGGFSGKQGDGYFFRELLSQAQGEQSQIKLVMSTLNDY